jgi:hypothetical protein
MTIRIFYHIIIIIIINLLSIQISFSAEKTINLAGQWPLNYCAKNICTDNARKYLYMGDGDRLNILTSDLNLISTSAITTAGQIDGMFYQQEQKRIYAACKNDGLKIIDVSDVETPLEIGSYKYPNQAVEFIGVCVDEERAFLACGSSGVLIVDISDLSSPLLLQEVDLPGAWVIYSYAVDIYAEGNYVWVADLLNGIRIINIKDIEKPILKNILLPNVRDLEVSGSYMYASVEANGMQIIGISNPEQPKQLSIFLTSGNAEAVRAEDNFAYIAYAFGSAGIRILDVTDKAKPVADKTWAYTESDAKSIALFQDDTSLYVTSNQADMKQIDISNKANMYTVASFDTPADAISIDVSGSYLYMVDDNIGNTPEKEGLRILKITSPNPESIVFNLAGYCATPGEAKDVVVSGRYAFVADGDQGLQIIDTYDSKNPTIIGNVETSSYAKGVYVKDNYAFVAVDDRGIDIVDVQDATNPSLISSLDTPGNANAVSVLGDYAYVADGNNGVQLIDIKYKAKPKIVGNVVLSGEAKGIFVENSLAYVAAGKQGLVIMNISDKNNPVITSTYNTPGNANKVSVSGDYAYIADGDKGVCVVNISDPTHPVKDADWTFDEKKGHGGIALDVFSGYSDANENLYAFIADGPAGVVSAHLEISGDDTNNNSDGGGGGGGCFIGALFN